MSCVRQRNKIMYIRDVAMEMLSIFAFFSISSVFSAI